MAHIPDGVLAAPVLVTGALASTGLLTVALRRLDDERLPLAAVLAALFFVASLVHFPVGISSAHLLLNGLLGLLLGWTAVPALFVALLLQAIFFGFGGLLSLGVNTMNMALPALACALLLQRWLADAGPRQAFWVGAGAGALGVALTAFLLACSIGASQQAFIPAARILLLIYLPLLLLEALISGTVLAFLQRVAPELLSLHHGRETRDEP